MSYALRTYRHRNPRSNETEQQSAGNAFFHQKARDTGNTKSGSFFQAKLSVNQPGDAYEKEADAVAGSIVNHSGGSASMVQQKKISGIQRLASDKEEEKLGTNEERMRRDKEIQTKPEIQRMCPECEKEKEGNVQRQVDPEKEEDPMAGPATMQRKSEGGSAGTASAQTSAKIEQSAGTGKPMSRKTESDMSASFGYDFSDVTIHTDADAVDMNKELGAQAFTHGRDIYFNMGKYNPETSEGKFLLAHELTHVIQQNSDIREMPIQRDCNTHPKESFYIDNPNYCKDGFFSSILHRGQTCYRQIPHRTSPDHCPGSEQVCFDKDGKCVNSYDNASPVEGREDDGSCNIQWSGPCADAHDKKDKVTETFIDTYLPWVKYLAPSTDCLTECQKQPWYLQGFCMQGCGGMPMMPM